MHLVEQCRIDCHDARFAPIDAAAFASKNLYNRTLYLMRQRFMADHTIITYSDLDKLMQPTEQYKALPAKVSQWVLKQVTLAWKSYDAACQAWNADPAKFFGHPKLPKYLDKQGLNLLTYTEQGISKVKIRDGVVDFSGLTIAVSHGRPCPPKFALCPTRHTIRWRSSMIVT